MSLKSIFHAVMIACQNKGIEIFRPPKKAYFHLWAQSFHVIFKLWLTAQYIFLRKIQLDLQYYVPMRFLLNASLKLIRLWYPKVETVFKNSNLELVLINNRNSTVIKTCFYSKKLQSCKNYSWLQMCSSFRQISEKTSVVEHQEIS